MKPNRASKSISSLLPGGRVLPARWFVLGYTIVFLLVALLEALARTRGILILIAAGPILYAAIVYPRRVYSYAILLAGLLESAAAALAGRLDPGYALLCLATAAVLFALAGWVHALMRSLDQTRRALRDSEERYRTFVQRFHGIAYKGNLDGTPIFIHGAVEAITGYAREDFLSGRLHWTDIIDPADRQRYFLTPDSDSPTVPAVREIEYRIVRKDGALRWISHQATLPGAETGAAPGLQVALYDITARKQAEEALRESETRFRALFSAMQEGFALFEPVRDSTPFANSDDPAVVDYRVVEANPAFEAALLLGHGQARRASLVTLFPNIWPGLLNAFEEVLTNGLPQQIVYYSPRHDRHLQIRFFQPSPGHVAILLSDITERQRIEAALKESQAHFRTLFEDSPIALWDEDFASVKRMVDEHKSRGIDDLRAYLHAHPAEIQRFTSALIVRHVNRAAERMIPVVSRVTLPETLANVVSGLQTESIIEQIQAIAEGRTSFDWEGVNSIIDSEPRYHRVVWSVAPGSEKSYARVIVAIDDVTARKRAEEALVYLSTHDTLTGLYNRTYFDAELDRLNLSRQHPVSIFFVDIDGLKQSNDTYGHHIGDELLRRAGLVLRLAFRAEDVVARIGGDELGVLLPYSGEETAATALQRVQQLLANENAAHPTPALSFSIGVATAQKGDDLRDTLRRADENMYSAKRAGR